MASRLQQVAEAIVLQLEAGEAANVFSKAIATERQYDTEIALEDTDIISVMAVPVRSNRTRKSTGTWNRDCVFDVMVRKRFAQSDYNAAGGVDREQIDEYVALLEEIDDYLATPAQHQLTAYPDAIYLEDDTHEADSTLTRDLGIVWPWIPRHLHEWHQYTGVVRVAYQVEVDY